jgi:ubiquinone/menaquinone biosynthesis C-methylase UbiE
MKDAAEQAQIEAATAYESLFVPGLFEQWTAKVANAAGIQPGQRVLDVACGTGVLARHVARRVGASGTVAGLDPSPGMLTVAHRHAPAVDWRRGTAESLPFDARSFDAVVSQFGLMFFTDRPQAVREMMRVLTPGGRIAVAVWDRIENNPAYAAQVDLLTRLAGRAPADALRAPFMLGDRQVLAKVFEDAAVRQIDITTHAGIARFPSIRVVLEADLRGWLPMVGLPQSEETIDRVLAAADDALGAYVSQVEGGIEFDLSVHIVSAEKADPATALSSS